jgi:hypothetical protein
VLVMAGVGNMLERDAVSSPISKAIEVLSSAAIDLTCRSANGGVPILTCEHQVVLGEWNLGAKFASCFRSFGFELQGPCSAFTSWRAHIRNPKAFPLAAHNQELVLRHMTFALQQFFQISFERSLCLNHRIERFLHRAAGKSSASMFCHFNSPRAIVLLQLGWRKGTRTSVRATTLGHLEWHGSL